VLDGTVRKGIPEDRVLTCFLSHIAGVKLGLNFDLAAQPSLGGQEPRGWQNRSGRGGGQRGAQGDQAHHARGWRGDNRGSLLPYSGANWCAFFEAVGHPECIEEFSVRDPVARARNIDRIYDRMRDIAPNRTMAEWEELLLRIDVPHTGFAKLNEVMEQPHLKAVGLFQELDHPTEGKIRQARPPARFSGSPAGVHRLAPRLGEHTREVLREVGYGEAEMEQLVETKAVRMG
jgi:hypothetical protein